MRKSRLIGSERPPFWEEAEPQIRVKSGQLQSTQRTQHHLSPCPRGLRSPWAEAALTAGTSQRDVGKPRAPVPTAFLSWEIAGLLCITRQGPGALDLTLGALNTHRLFSRLPTLSDLYSLTTQAPWKVTRTKAPTQGFQEGCARIFLEAARAII